MRAIDADELIKRLNLAIAILKIQNKNLDVEDDAESQMELKAYRDIRDSIKEMPTIEPERKTGKWLTNEEIVRPTRFLEWHCSRCGYVFESVDSPGYKFCPGCGSRMENGNEN